MCRALKVCSSNSCPYRITRPTQRHEESNQIATTAPPGKGRFRLIGVSERSTKPPSNLCQVNHNGFKRKGDEITPEERKIIIKLRNEGKTLREIGKIVGRTHSSIQRVINNYTSSKFIISKARSGRPSKLKRDMSSSPYV
ncbi:hypothetical protein CDAR_131 [Caerostris darwini]|uniref:Transposase IS30-like HTH domain-containing protein n=1 Tax=Caerostris darwini TaxID=1538125 RepID=A0AAV4MWM4_9ARAC|nr:hypothetical protein CDAR_131 [Caerostris darwini]